MNIKTFLNKLLKVLPGFRTGKKPNQVIAIIYYLLCLVVLTAGVGYSLFMISLPFIVFSAVGLLKDKNKIHAIWLIAAIFIFIVGVWVTPQTDKTASSNKVSVSSKSTLNSNKSDSKAAKTTKDTDKSSDIKMTNTVTNTDKTVAGQLKIHYIDVGQGDSILIQQGSQNMLIDTGTNASTNSLMSYLQSQNIKKIDVLVLTHPHEDHIGGADAVIKGFDIGTLYMNKVTTTTKTYEDAIKAISSKGLKPIEPTSGTTFNLGNATCTVLSPINSSYKDLNTYSVVIKMTFGNNKFLFTGDTQTSNEQDMINKGYDLSADVLKIAHHGSDTSTSQTFLDKVNPKYAVISVGKENDY
jgi:competence protein ComEC